MERDFQLMQWLQVHSYAEAWIGEHHSGGSEIYGRPKLLPSPSISRTFPLLRAAATPIAAGRLEPIAPKSVGM